MVESNGIWTPTEAKILTVLQDGMSHRMKELQECLPDEMGAPANVRNHLKHIRKRLRMKGQDIICQYIDRRYTYRWIRLGPIRTDE